MSVTHTKVPRTPQSYEELLARLNAEAARWFEVISDLVNADDDIKEQFTEQALRYICAVDRQRVMEIDAVSLKEILYYVRYEAKPQKKKKGMVAAAHSSGDTIPHFVSRLCGSEEI